MIDGIETEAVTGTWIVIVGISVTLGTFVSRKIAGMIVDPTSVVIVGVVIDVLTSGQIVGEDRRPRGRRTIRPLSQDPLLFAISPVRSCPRNFPRPILSTTASQVMNR